MRKLLLAALTALALAGCVTAQPPAKAPLTDRVSASIAKGTDAIEQACAAEPLAHLAFVAAVDLGYVTSPKVIAAVEKAHAAAVAVCAAPVRDVPSALRAVSDAYAAVVRATPQPAT